MQIIIFSTAPSAYPRLADKMEDKYSQGTA